MIKYFHELTKAEFNELLKTKTSWEPCAKDYPQPIWCSYPDAVCGEMGCWSLMSFNKDGTNWVTGRKYCKGCDCYIKRLKPQMLKEEQQTLKIAIVEVLKETLTAEQENLEILNGIADRVLEVMVAWLPDAMARAWKIYQEGE